MPDDTQNIRLAVDAIVFGYKNQQLEVLLIKRKFGDQKGLWALPGGFVLENESLDACVERELEEEAGISLNYLEQLYTFGDVNRDPRGRIVSVAYFGIVNPENHSLKADTDAEDAQWFSITELPDLAFDHHEIIQLAHKRLVDKLSYQPIGFNLLPTKFLFSDLENLYSTLLNVELDRRNFRKKILSFGLLEETNEVVSQGAGRPAKLFQFNLKKYKQLENKGFHFEIKLA